MDTLILPDPDIPENWLDDVIETLDFTYAMNEPTKAEKRAKLLRQREVVRNGQRKYRRKYPDKIKVRAANRKARQHDLPEGLTADEWGFALQYFDNCCAVCGRPAGLWHTIAQDHWIPVSANNDANPGTVATNIVPLCHGYDGCNNSKHDKPADEWLIGAYGKRKAGQIMKRIEEYFTIVRERQSKITS